MRSKEQRIKEMKEIPVGTIVRTGYEASIRGIYDFFMAIRTLRNSDNSEDWTNIEGFCEMFKTILLPNKKRRIIIDYDPAKERVECYAVEDEPPKEEE